MGIFVNISELPTAFQPASLSQEVPIAWNSPQVHLLSSTHKLTHKKWRMNYFAALKGTGTPHHMRQTNTFPKPGLQVGLGFLIRRVYCLTAGSP